ncbi:restriction endonuclease subunit S [Alkalihalobacillus sp. LMS39]|uniref:restriction endonuclease subunit S n=1 Tax=Alkalihalobacillus sp. LMS39 TaxID=2924032 RepID=UPI001FB29597|nr:restriction endonuclease subunit S [Alkalihalobacillus sp. LMS39]UOE94397.1 restriction endonuclease subunit S [Alkalihalobacillus sp. LMS39]
MELKENEVPLEGWQEKRIGDVLEVKYGKSQKNIEVDNSDIPILGTGGIIGWANKPLFDKESVLIGRKGTIDRPQYMDRPFWTIDTLFYTDIDTNLVVPKFMYYLFQNINWYRYNEATGVPSLSASNISAVKFYCPPLNEQKEIANILSTFDRQIEETDFLIEKTIVLKNGLVQKLMKEGIGNKEFKKTEVGDIPLDWEVRLLSDITIKIGDGVHSTPEYSENGDVAFINGNNLVSHRIGKLGNAKRISRRELEKHPNHLVNDSVLISINGTIGNTAIYKGEQVLLGKSVAYINVNKEEVSELFLMYALESYRVQKYFQSELTGTTIKNLSLKTIRNLKLPLPSLEEQQKIASIIFEIDNQINHYLNIKSQLQNMKNGLAKQLLKGKIRVNI